MTADADIEALSEHFRSTAAVFDGSPATGPLFHVWIEPPDAPHHRYTVDESGVVAMHGPGDDAATPLVRVDGHLHWLEQVR